MTRRRPIPNPPFADTVNDLIAVVRKRVGEEITWRHVEVIEMRFDTETLEHWPRRPSLEDYEGPWRSVLARCDRWWVNLSLLGVRGDVLEVVVEYFGSDDPLAQQRDVFVALSWSRKTLFPDSQRQA